MSEATPFQRHCQEFLPIVQAGAEGKSIQYQPATSNVWYDKQTTDKSFTFGGNRYRVKPEPTHRPFTPGEAVHLLSEWLRGDDGITYEVVAIERDGVRLSNRELVTYARLLENFKVTGHRVCGVLVGV